MFLRSTHIRHYKSLDDVRVEFTRPITVIVGPNAAGKSNFVDALRFAGEMASAANVQTRREAVQHHGGIERIRSRATAAGEIVSIALDMDTDAGSGHASVTLEPAGQQQYAARVGVQPASLSEEVFPHWRLTPAPTLLVIEEPEHTVYPGALGVLVDAMREASEQTQIILTTHSPDLVHYFKPDEIRVATIENGHTRIAPICAPQRAAIDEHLMTAEEFMRAEGLQPEPAQAPAA